jgi:acyl carrier protein
VSVPAETHSHGAGLTRDEVAAIVVDRLAELLGIEADEVRYESRLRADLDADDLVIIDLIDAIEAELGERTIAARIDDDAIVELDSVGDAIDCVCQHLGIGEAAR